MAKDTPITPSEQTYRCVRAGLIVRGESISSWSRDHGYQRQNVAAALIGKWRGPKAEKLVAEISAYLDRGGGGI